MPHVDLSSPPSVFDRRSAALWRLEELIATLPYRDRAVWRAAVWEADAASLAAGGKIADQCGRYNVTASVVGPADASAETPQGRKRSKSMDNNDQIKRYAEFVAARLDAALASIESPDTRERVREALGPALALCGVSACGLPTNSPAIARSMLVCANDMARNGVGGAPDTAPVAGPWWPDGVQ